MSRDESNLIHSKYLNQFFKFGFNLIRKMSLSFCLNSIKFKKINLGPPIINFLDYFLFKNNIYIYKLNAPEKTKIKVFQHIKLALKSSELSFGCYG